MFTHVLDIVFHPLLKGIVKVHLDATGKKSCIKKVKSFIKERLKGLLSFHPRK